VNLEIMRDECWKCKYSMRTVTGIVFPDRQLSRWDNPDWQYFNQLLRLAQITGAPAKTIQQVVDRLRQTDRSITPVSDRYSKTQEGNYLAAGCPNCNALRGDFHVADYRMRYLHTLDSRWSGELEYRSISLPVNEAMVAALSDGYEGSDHATGTGWKRLTGPGLVKPQQRN
jgi:hypothetical protein